MTLHPRLAAAGLMLSVVLAACSEPSDKKTEAPAGPAPAPAAAPHADAYNF